MTDRHHTLSRPHRALVGCLFALCLFLGVVSFLAALVVVAIFGGRP